jgi:hypothetical protein
MLKRTHIITVNYRGPSTSIYRLRIIVESKYIIVYGLKFKFCRIKMLENR